MKLYTAINEFVESPQYIIGKWYKDLELDLNIWFESELGELEFNYFEYNVSGSSSIYVGNLYFNEDDYTYKLEIIIDADEITAADNIIEELNIKFYVYNNEGQTESLFNYEDLIEADMLTSEYLLELLNKFHEEN